MRELPSGASTIVTWPLTVSDHPAGAMKVCPAPVALGVSAASGCAAWALVSCGSAATLIGGWRSKPHPARITNATRVIVTLRHLPC